MQTIPPALIGALLCMMASCERPAVGRADAGWWSLESERVALANRVELLRIRFEKAEARAGNHADLSQAVAGAVVRIAGLEGRAGELRAELAKRTAELAEVRGSRMRELRAAAVGRRFETLSRRGGQVYEDVVITKVSDIGIDFRHKDGLARLSAMQMDGSQLALFGLDRGQAEAARNEERSRVAAYEAQVDRVVAARMDVEREEAQERKMAQAELRKARELQAVSLAAMENSGTRLNERPRRISNRTTYAGPSIYYYSGGGLRGNCSPAPRPVQYYFPNGGSPVVRPPVVCPPRPPSQVAPRAPIQPFFPTP